MSSLPLISHHLFVAAVNDKDWAASASASNEAPNSTCNDRSTEIPLEVVKFNHALRVKPCNPVEDMVRGGRS